MLVGIQEENDRRKGQICYEYCMASSERNVLLSSVLFMESGYVLTDQISKRNRQYCINYISSVDQFLNVSPVVEYGTRTAEPMTLPVQMPLKLHLM